MKSSRKTFWKKWINRGQQRFSFARSFSTAFTAHSKPTNVFQCSSIVFSNEIKNTPLRLGLNFRDTRSK
ncbi:unnamed protein product [Clavelina lepadiformis]|uniref:Ribosomal protein L32 n=1 Tax=Clavelina lepadiformis TaxID=159417 RepID=A0ABP0EV60_CLALP